MFFKQSKSKKMKLTNEEIAKVFAMYLGCPVILEDGQVSDALCSTISNDGYVMVDYNGIGETQHEASDCKLLLNPLSKISDEDAIEVAKMYYSPTQWSVVESYKGSALKEFYDRDKRDTAFLYNDLSFGGESHEAEYFHKDTVFQYLISKGYAVPLFFTPNHWANGKTAIELGIAIEKQ